MTVIPIRSNKAYTGLSKQTQQGVAVAPSTFLRWIDGTSLEIDMKTEDIWEGDGSRRLSMVIKNGQTVKIKHVCYARPNEALILEQAALGSSSDTYTAPTVAHLLAASSLANATSVQIDSNTGLTSAGSARLVIGPGTANEEVAAFTTPATGSGTPYTLTVANSGTLTKAHTGPTVSRTFAAGTSIGASSITVDATTGLTGSGTITLKLSPGTAREESAVFALPVVDDEGTYTLSLSSGTLAKAHNTSDVVTDADVIKGSASHALTDQSDGDYYTWEVSIGDTSGIILRVKDCKLESCKRSAKSGTLLQYETEWIGLATTSQVSAATVTLDPHLPFFFSQGVWTLDGSAAGDALEVQSMDITNKNNMDTIQTERLISDASIFGNISLEVNIDVLFQNADKLRAVYFGSTSGTTDSQTMGTGSLSLTFTQADGFHTLTYAIPSMTYKKATIPQPKKDGKAWWLPLQAASNSSMGTATYLVRTTITNTTYSAA